MYINCCYFYLRVRPCKELRICFSSFFFYCPPKKIRPGKAEKNEKASSLYRLRQLTIAKKMKRCVPLRRNVAEKPRGMRLKFVLSQLRTCTHESENMFVFFKSWTRFSLVQPVKLGGISFNLVPRSHFGRGRSGYKMRGRLKRMYKMLKKNNSFNIFCSQKHVCKNTISDAFSLCN